MARRPTIVDVAEKTSRSISTVSLVINEKPNVSEETRKKVLKAIDELGYHPHRGARGLASKLSGNIGFILTEDHFNQTEPFYTRIFLGTEFEARDHHYYVLLTTVDKQFRKHGSIPRFLLERNVDGVIIAGKINEKYVDYILKLGLPIVLVDYALPRNRVSSVVIDNYVGAQAAVRHLLDYGRRAIAFIGGDIEHPSIAERRRGYEDTLREAGIKCPASWVDTVEEDTGPINGFRAMERVLARGVTPNAVFAANDAMAIGCMRCIKQRGMKIPDDIAVVGFDDIEMSSHVEPQLTTVRVFKEEMGKLAVRRLVEMIKSKSETIVTIRVPVQLVVRGTTAGQNHPSQHPEGIAVAE